MLSVALNIFTSLAVFQRGFRCPNQLSQVKTLMASKQVQRHLALRFLASEKILPKFFFLESQILTGFALRVWDWN